MIDEVVFCEIVARNVRYDGASLMSFSLELLGIEPRL